MLLFGEKCSFPGLCAQCGAGNEHFSPNNNMSSNLIQTQPGTAERLLCLPGRSGNWAEPCGQNPAAPGAGMCVGVRTDPQPRATGSKDGPGWLREGTQHAAPQSGPLPLTMRGCASLGGGTPAGCWIQVLAAAFPASGPGAAPGLLSQQCLVYTVGVRHR